MLDDHDLIVTISTDLKWMKERLIDHEKKDAANHAIVQNSVEKAHVRIDDVNGRFNWLVIAGIFSVIVLAGSVWFKP